MDTTVGPTTQKLLEKADTIKASMEDTHITAEHIILAMMTQFPEITTLFTEQNISLKHLNDTIASMRNGKKVTSEHHEEHFDALSKYAKDITALAESGKIDPIIGRETEIRRMMQILSRRTKNNPVLVGDPGVGKTALIE